MPWPSSDKGRWCGAGLAGQPPRNRGRDLSLKKKNAPDGGSRAAEQRGGQHSFLYIGGGGARGAIP